MLISYLPSSSTTLYMIMLIIAEFVSLTVAGRNALQIKNKCGKQPDNDPKGCWKYVIGLNGPQKKNQRNVFECIDDEYAREQTESNDQLFMRQNGKIAFNINMYERTSVWRHTICPKENSEKHRIALMKFVMPSIYHKIAKIDQCDDTVLRTMYSNTK